MTVRSIALALSAASLLTAGACRRRAEPAPVPAAADSAALHRRADSLAALQAMQRRADSLAAAEAAARAAASRGTQTELLQTLGQKVYFDYDRDVLRDDARAVLDAKAALLAVNPGVALVITGHTDERGTAEYNLALGQRRAAQVKRYLESKGIAGERLTAQSLGDSQPAATGTDETAYQQNRRAEFEVRGAGGALVRPQP